MVPETPRPDSLLTWICRLVDDEGNDITDYDVRGELCVRGPTVVRQYFNNEKANNESWDEDGFFHTGDIMYCDGKSKKWYIVDRKKVNYPRSHLQIGECLTLV